MKVMPYKAMAYYSSAADDEISEYSICGALSIELTAVSSNGRKRTRLHAFLL